MKLKRIIIAILVICLAALPFAVTTAQPRYTADFDFLISVNNKSVKTDSEYIYLYSGDKIDISLNLKTGEDYYAGPFSAEIFYSDSSLTYNDFNWNTSGRFYSCCKSYSNLSKKKDADKTFLKVDMIPSSVDCQAAPDSLDEKLFTMNFTAFGKRDDIAAIYLSDNSVRDTDNPFGGMYLACYTDNGRLDGDRYDYGEAINFDLTDANVNFKITDAGDMNSDGKISSADALSILQYATGVITLTDKEFEKADINSNEKVNSADGLAALQIATGLATINDILNG